MNKKQAIFWTDSALVPLFLLTFYTGVKLHVAGHGEDHAVWHYWAVFHALAGFVFTLFGTIHVKDHRGWYKGLKNRGVNGRAQMVLALSFTAVLVVATGVALLLWGDGANPPIGLLHYKTGLVTGLLGVLHIFKRRRFFTGNFKMDRKSRFPRRLSTPRQRDLYTSGRTDRGAFDRSADT